MKYTAGDITVNFNAEHFKGWTEEEFIAHEKHHGLTTAQLKEAFAQIPQAIKEEKKEAKAQEEQAAAIEEKKAINVKAAQTTPAVATLEVEAKK